LASFDCRLKSCVEFASHGPLIGEVGRTVVVSEAGRPPTYVDGAFTTSVLPEDKGA
jgi:flavin reductase (DIM6/NTAB) family NADH-FMN oxidoreductase RutF